MEDEDEVELQSVVSVPEAHKVGSSQSPSLANRQLSLPGVGGGGGVAVTVGEAADISLKDIATTVAVVPRSVRAVLIPVTMADISVVNVVAAL